MKRASYIILKTPEFEKWFISLTVREQVQIRGRLSNIENEGYFGEQKRVGDDGDIEVWELKWKIGRRVYFAYLPEMKILLLLRGNKNGQDKDINEAKKILRKHYT